MLSELSSKLGYPFRNPALLELALTHPSFSHESRIRGASRPHNERLEFLGDAVLELAITEHLYHLSPDANEGRLTKIRAHLANRSALQEIAESLDLGRHLRLGEAEAAHGGRQRPSSLANVVEAIIGAMFLDGGYEPARAFVVRHIEPRLKQIAGNPEPENAKGILQEKLHAIGKNPVYRLLAETGPAHQKQFESAVEVEGRTLGTGKGGTKKEAEMCAAMAALKLLQVSGSASDGR